MENKLVIGILNIVEDKLREFNIQIPDDDREDSKDPIVGYQYAELHDLIKEYLEEQGVMEEDKDFVRPAEKVKVYGISIVNSEGFMDGSESYVDVRGSLRESLAYAYGRYKDTWQELKDNGELSGARLKPQRVFEDELMKYGYVGIQLDDYHVCFERFEREMSIPRNLSVDSLIQRASERSGGETSVEVERDFGL